MPSMSATVRVSKERYERDPVGVSLMANDTTRVIVEDESGRPVAILGGSLNVSVPVPAERTCGAIPMILICPNPRCLERHIDDGVWATKEHHTHACQHCGFVWRPAVVATVGVRFLPGFKNDDEGR